METIAATPELPALCTNLRQAAVFILSFSVVFEIESVGPHRSELLPLYVQFDADANEARTAP